MCVSPRRDPRDTHLRRHSVHRRDGIPSELLTGETPAHSQATVEEAREFAASIDTDTPQIALPASVETQIETQSKPYTAAAFFHFKATESLERHRAYHAAYDSDAYTVDFEADYESGNLTITVDRADDF